MKWKTLAAALAAILFGSTQVMATSIPLVTGPIEASNVLNTFNSVINSINAGAMTAGAGATSSAITIANTANAVNALSITPAATGGTLLLSVGASQGATADTNAPVALKGNGTGSVLLGGATTTLAGLQVLQIPSQVNDFVVTPAATAGTPGILAGGAGADATESAAFGTGGTGNIQFITSGNKEQFEIDNTASAVDFLACTGAATANPAAVTCSGSGSDSNVGLNIIPKGTGIVKLGAATTCTASGGIGTVACAGQQMLVTITGLATAASTLSGQETVTNATVIGASNSVVCSTEQYAGTGVPIVANIIPGAGNVKFNILNASTGAALNANVIVACEVIQ